MSFPSFGHHSLLLALVLTVAACASSNRAPTSASGGEERQVDAGSADAAVDEHPYAATTEEATSFITEAVDARRDRIERCVTEFRGRNKLLKERVSVSFGIGQDGLLLGVTAKGREDLALKECVRSALADARFPRSHAGVITVTKSYAEPNP